MTTAEVAAYLRLKERTVYEMASRGQIPCTRATGKLLFPRRLVDRWLEAHTDVPGARVAAPPPIYAGSSDPLLEWALRACDSGLAVLARGSADGLERLARGEAALAGIHLLDAQTRTYNVEAIRRALPFPDVVSIRLCAREQGLLVAAGNPLGLSGIEDVARVNARVALRPEGAGSRLLLDVLCARAGIAPDALETVARPAQTQGDLAALIASGEADAGIGVRAAAVGAGLGFVPLGIVEPFDVVMRRRDYFEPPVQALMRFLLDPAFAETAERLGGYDIAEAGRVVLNA
ncbi:helix-turn-helix transcriptional regulator [Salinarimonas ramus]|nr:helix-turn-helix transcriptional regulator [Salinarimonas ramus]